MVVDSSILEKLRQASQQYNNRKKQLTSRVDTWHCLTQSDSQTFPSTQACTSIHSSQQTRTRFPSSQWEIPLNDVKMSQATSSTRQSSSIPLSFDAYCQTELMKPVNERSVAVLTSPIKPPRLTIDIPVVPTVLNPPDKTTVETQTSGHSQPQTDPQLLRYFESLTEKVDVGFRDVIAAVGRNGENAKSRNSETEDDELVYLSFLFEHDEATFKLVDAPVTLKETSIKPLVLSNQPAPRKRSRKSQPTPLLSVKEDDDVALSTIQTSFTSGLKRARLPA